MTERESQYPFEKIWIDVRKIQVYRTHYIVEIENPQQEDSAVGSLSLFCFQQSIFASEFSAFLKNVRQMCVKNHFSKP